MGIFIAFSQPFNGAVIYEAHKGCERMFCRLVFVCDLGIVQPLLQAFIFEEGAGTCDLAAPPARVSFDEMDNRLKGLSGSALRWYSLNHG